jgi:putative Holliday junction resolvase
MPIGLLKDVLKDKQNNIRLLGMDISKNNIGLSVSDSALKIATPVRTIKRKKFTKDILLIAEVIKEYDIKGFILGYPLNMDGTEGKSCEMVKHFAQEMLNHPDIFGKDPWIALWDERLSTSSVEGFLIESLDMSRNKRKNVEDALAAQHILQGAIDFITGQ